MKEQAAAAKLRTDTPEGLDGRGHLRVVVLVRVMKHMEGIPDDQDDITQLLGEANQCLPRGRVGYAPTLGPSAKNLDPLLYFMRIDPHGLRQGVAVPNSDVGAFLVNVEDPSGPLDLKVAPQRLLEPN